LIFLHFISTKNKIVSISISAQTIYYLCLMSLCIWDPFSITYRGRHGQSRRSLTLPKTDFTPVLFISFIPCIISEISQLIYRENKLLIYEYVTVATKYKKNVIYI